MTSRRELTLIGGVAVGSRGNNKLGKLARSFSWPDLHSTGLNGLVKGSVVRLALPHEGEQDFAYYYEIAKEGIESRVVIKRHRVVAYGLRLVEDVDGGGCLVEPCKIIECPERGLTPADDVSNFVGFGSEADEREIRQKALRKALGGGAVEIEGGWQRVSARMLSKPT